MNRSLILLLITIVLFNCQKKENHKINRGVIADHAMVVSARKEASKIGVQILKKGGNAFDAMVATELALAVAFPFAGNIGGGGFMVYRTSKGEIGALDYREKAPIAAHKDMFLDNNGNIIKGMSTKGATSVGVPGTIAGVFKVHEKFGTLPIDSIIQPVIDLAYKGVIVTKKQAVTLQRYKKSFFEVNKDTILHAKNWQENDTIKYTELARTLSRIVKNGSDEFYKGETAKKLAKFIQDNGGFITEKDLANYEAKWRNLLFLIMTI